MRDQLSITAREAVGGLEAPSMEGQWKVGVEHASADTLERARREPNAAEAIPQHGIEGSASGAESADAADMLPRKWTRLV